MLIRLLIGGSTLIVLTGASLLFSQIHPGDWRVCLALCACLLLLALIWYTKIPRVMGALLVGG